MKLKTSNLISGFENKTFDIPINQLAERGTIFSNKLIHCKLTTKTVAEGIELSGIIKATPKYKCVRCLEINPKSITLPIKLIITDNNNKHIENNRLDMIHLEGGKEFIDLNIIFADLIELAKPMKPLCRTNCKGLCPQCGVNKNHSCSCKVQEDMIDWEKLKNLIN